MDKVATSTHKQPDGARVEKRTYSIQGDLKVSVQVRIDPQGDEEIEFFSVAKKGTPSQRWTSGMMLDFVDGMSRVLRGEAT